MQTTFKHVSYEELLENNPDVASQEENCPECNGDGEIECFHCGSMNECETCGGTGKRNSSIEAYNAQVEHDEKMMQKYIASIGGAAERAAEA